MKIKLLILVAVSGLLAGCFKTVMVPYPVCPKSPPLTVSLLSLDKIRPEDPSEQILKAYVADHLTLKGDLRACMTLLKAYDNIPDQLPALIPSK